MFKLFCDIHLLGQSAGGHEPAYECKPTFLCRCQPTTFFPIGSPKPLQVLYFCLSEPSRAQPFTGVLPVYLVHLLLLLACKKNITIASLLLLLKPYKRLIQP